MFEVMEFVFGITDCWVFGCLLRCFGGCQINCWWWWLRDPSVNWWLGQAHLQHVPNWEVVVVCWFDELWMSSVNAISSLDSFVLSSYRSADSKRLLWPCQTYCCRALKVFALSQRFLQYASEGLVRGLSLSHRASLSVWLTDHYLYWSF